MKFYLFAKIQVCNFEMFTYKLQKVKELYVVLTLMVKNLPISTWSDSKTKQSITTSFGQTIITLLK